MITISKLYLLTSLGVDFSFWPLCCSEASHRQHCALGSRTNLKLSGRVLAFPFNLYLKIKFSKIIVIIINVISKFRLIIKYQL